MRSYLISARRRDDPKHLGEWLNVIIEAIGIHDPTLPSPKITWHVRHALGDVKGVGPFRENVSRLAQADFEVQFPDISNEIVERWVLLRSFSSPFDWHFILDEISGGKILVRAGRDYPSVCRALKVAFDDAGIYPKELNKAIGFHLVKE